MKKFIKRGIVNIWLIVIIFIVVIIIGYFAFMDRLVSKDQQSNSIVPAKTYNSNATQIQSPSNQVVSVRVSIYGMNEPVFALIYNKTILDRKYLYIRNADSIVTTIDPGSLSISDSCVDVVNAQFEIANPKVETNHKTFRGDSMVSVDVIKVISHEIPKRICTY